MRESFYSFGNKCLYSDRFHRRVSFGTPLASSNWSGRAKEESPMRSKTWIWSLIVTSTFFISLVTTEITIRISSADFVNSKSIGDSLAQYDSEPQFQLMKKTRKPKKPKKPKKKKLPRVALFSNGGSDGEGAPFALSLVQNLDKQNSIPRSTMLEPIIARVQALS